MTLQFKFGAKNKKMVAYGDECILLVVTWLVLRRVEIQEISY